MKQRTMVVALGFCCAVLLGGACAQRASADDQIAEKTARETRLDTALADSAGPTNEPLARWVLPTALREISGVALVRDGRLLVHGDERAVIWEVDYRSGILVKEFSVGTPPLAKDFEGITSVGERLFMIASTGDLYEFREGKSGEHVKYNKLDTKLGKECEFEGVAYDSTINSLLLPCKRIREKSLGDGIAIYRYKLEKGDDRLSTLTVPLANVVGSNGWTQIHPSDITVDPATGNYVIVASQQKAIVVMTPAGEVVKSESLPKGHAQPEGIAITPNRILIVSDEAGANAANITLYRWR